MVPDRPCMLNTDSRTLNDQVCNIARHVYSEVNVLDVNENSRAYVTGDWNSARSAAEGASLGYRVGSSALWVAAACSSSCVRVFEYMICTSRGLCVLICTCGASHPSSVECPRVSSTGQLPHSTACTDERVWLPSWQGERQRDCKLPCDSQSSYLARSVYF